MAITDKASLLASIRDFLHDPYGDRYSDEFIYEMMQEGLDEIANETTFFRTQITYNTALTIDGLYPLPDNTVELINIFYNYCEVPIIQEDCPCRICPTAVKPEKVFVDTNTRFEFRFYPIPIPDPTDTTDTTDTIITFPDLGGII